MIHLDFASGDILGPALQHVRLTVGLLHKLVDILVRLGYRFQLVSGGYVATDRVRVGVLFTAHVVGVADLEGVHLV